MSNRKDLEYKINFAWTQLSNAVLQQDIREVIKWAFSLKNYYKRLDIQYESPQDKE